MRDPSPGSTGNDDICAVLDQLIAGGDVPAALAAHPRLQDFLADHAHHAARLARLRDELAA